MVYTNSPYHPSLVELARAGNFGAISHWLNQSFMPYGIRAHVGGVRPGCLKVLLELQPLPEHRELVSRWREYLVRFICHRIWQLNSARIEGVRIAVWFNNETGIRWQQAVKVVAPARRQKMQQSQELRSRINQTSRQKAQLKTARTLLMSAPLLFAFVFGAALAFVKAPVEPMNAAAGPTTDSNQATTDRPTTVQAALETVPVIKHDQVANPADPMVSLMFAGDVTLSDHFADAIGQNYEQAFAAMPEYRQADLAMVNLENPLTRATTPLAGKQFAFKADPAAVKVLEAGGVDIVTLANNHTMDYQEAGLEETIATLDQAGIQHVGAGRNVKDARRPDIIEVKGQRIAYLGYYSADFEIASETRAGSNYAEEKRIAEDIQALRKQVDWIIVNYHWGAELATHPADWQMELARFTIDQGADVVVGHHPHVLQGAEIYKGRPIAYSLGNFIFGGNPRRDYDTAVLKVAVNKDKQMKVEFLPVEVRNYQPKVVSGDRGVEILQQIDDRSASFQEPLRSTAVLDARVSPEPTPVSPASPPADTPIEAGDTEPATPSPIEGQSPVPDPSAPAGQTTPEAAPRSDQAPTPNGFGQPSNSFINSPNRTPMRSLTAEPSPSPAPETSPEPEPQASNPPTQDSSNWRASNQVGEQLIPHVSTLAATIW